MLHRECTARSAGLQGRCTTAATVPMAMLRRTLSGVQERGEAGEEQLQGGQCWDPGTEAVSACCMQSLQLTTAGTAGAASRVATLLMPKGVRGRYRPPACALLYPRLRPQLSSAKALPQSLQVSDSMYDGNSSTLDLRLTSHPGCRLHNLHHAPPPEAKASARPLLLHNLQEA